MGYNDAWNQWGQGNNSYGYAPPMQMPGYQTPQMPAIQGYGSTPIQVDNPLLTNPYGAATAVPGTFQSPGAPGGGNWWDGAINTKEAPGWGGMAIGAASGIANAWMGMKQYGLAKDSLAQNKQQFETNFAAQKGITNSQMEDRQKARVASNPNAYQSPSEYMSKNGVK